MRGRDGRTLWFKSPVAATKKRDQLYAATQKATPPRPAVAPAAPERVAKAPETPGAGTTEKQPWERSLVREPWEMRPADYIAEYERILDEKMSAAGRSRVGTPPTDIRIRHRSLVETALREGTPVPAEVLADYPDLAPPVASRETPSAGTTAREPWEMTRAEVGIGDAPVVPPAQSSIRQKFGKAGPSEAQLTEYRRVNNVRARAVRDYAKYKERSNAHFYAVQDAIEAGKPVPAAVLADYPYLAPPAPPAPESPEVAPESDDIADIPSDVDESSERIPETPPDAIRRQNARSVVERSIERIEARRKHPTPGEAIPEPFTEAEVYAYMDRAGTDGSELLTIHARTSKSTLASDAFGKVRGTAQERVETTEGVAPAGETTSAATGTGESETELRKNAPDDDIDATYRSLYEESLEWANSEPDFANNDKGYREWQAGFRAMRKLFERLGYNEEDAIRITREYHGDINFSGGIPGDIAILRRSANARAKTLVGPAERDRHSYQIGEFARVPLPDIGIDDTMPAAQNRARLERWYNEDVAKFREYHEGQADSWEQDARALEAVGGDAELVGRIRAIAEEHRKRAASQEERYRNTLANIEKDAARPAATLEQLAIVSRAPKPWAELSAAERRAVLRYQNYGYRETVAIRTDLDESEVSQYANPTYDITENWEQERLAEISAGTGPVVTNGSVLISDQKYADRAREKYWGKRNSTTERVQRAKQKSINYGALLKPSGKTAFYQGYHIDSRGGGPNGIYSDGETQATFSMRQVAHVRRSFPNAKVYLAGNTGAGKVLQFIEKGKVRAVVSQLRNVDGLELPDPSFNVPAASGEQPAVQGSLAGVAGSPRGQRTAKPNKRLPHEVLADPDATQTDVDIAVDEMTEPIPGDDSWTFTEPTPAFKGKRVTRDDVKDVIADLMAAFGRRAVVRAGRVLPENAAQFDYRQWVARVRRQFNTLNEIFHEVAGHGVLAALNGRAGSGGLFGDFSRAAQTEIARLGYARYGDYEHLDEGFAELMRYMLGAGDKNTSVEKVAKNAAREAESLLRDDPVVWREFERARAIIGQYAAQGAVNRTVSHIRPLGKAREVLKRAYRTGRRAALREEGVFGKVRAVLAETSLADNWATSRASVKQMEREAEKIGGRAVKERVGEWELEQAIGTEDFDKLNEATKHNILLDLKQNPGWSRRSSVRTRVRKMLVRELSGAGVHPDIAATYAEAITSMGRTLISEKMKALNATADGVVEQFIKDGVYGADLVTNGPALMDALKLVRGREQEFKAYLIAEHDLEIRRWNADGNLKPGDTGYVEPKLIEGDAEALVEHYRSSEFAEAAEIVWKWNKAANEYIITHAPPEIRDFLRKVLGKWERYVPYATELDPDTQRIMGRQARMGNPLKVLRGTHEMIYDPLAVMVANKVRLIEYAFNESAVYDAIGLAADVGGMGYWVEEVDPKFRLDSVTIGKIAKQIEEITGVEIPEETRAEVVTFFTPLLRSSDTEPVYAKRVGRDIRLFYINPKLYESVYGMTRYRLPNGTPFASVIRAHAAVVRVQKAGTTAMRPVFTLVKAPFIDIPSAMHRTRGAGGAAAPITYLWYYSKAIGELMKPLVGMKTPYRDFLVRLGVDISNAYGHDIAQAKGVPAMRSTGPVKRVARAFNPLSWLKVWREAMGIEERTFRLAELMSVMKRLGIKPNADGTMPPVTEAQMVYLANAARHVINDWSDLGRATKAVNAHWKFFSVPAVVWRGTAEAAREFPIRTAIMVAGLAALGAWLWDKNKDDPEYRNMTAAEKNLYWHWGPIRIRRDDVLGIPSILLEAALARTYERAKGHPQWETEIADATKFIVGTTVPLVQPEGKFPWVELPSGVQPIWDIATNWKSFFGVPIIPRGESDLDPGYQRGPYTTRLAAFIGGTFDKKVFSPRKLDYLLYSYFGGFGLDIIDATDAIAGIVGYPEFGLGSGRLHAKDWSGLPVVGALVRPVSGQSKALDMLWSRIDDLSGIPTRERKSEQAGKLAYYELFARIASDYRDQMKDETLVASDRQTLQDEMNNILEVALSHGGRFTIGKKTRWAIFNGLDLQAATEIDRRRREMQVAYVNRYLESHRGAEIDWDEMMAAFERESAGELRRLEVLKGQINRAVRDALRDPDTSAVNLEKYEDRIREAYGRFQSIGD